MTNEASPAEKHRQIVFRAEFSHPLTRTSDEDLFFGDYIDATGQRVGRLLHRHFDASASHGLLIPDESIPLMHVSSTLDADHTVTSYDMVVALTYAPGEEPPAGVLASGDVWEAGEARIFLFEDDETAAIARSLD